MIKKDNANYLIKRPNPLLFKKTNGSWEENIGEYENWDFFAPPYVCPQKNSLKPIPSPEESIKKYEEEIEKANVHQQAEVEIEEATTIEKTPKNETTKQNKTKEQKINLIYREEDPLYSGDIFTTEKELEK